MSDAFFRLVRPYLEQPTRDDMGEAFTGLNALPVPWVESIDISNAVLWLASDEARYVTGVTLPVDAGMLVR
jgi:(+)-trans-carveol dehydrogenase